MLEKLKVSNLSVLGEIEVAFSNGLNIASGETGAGKSLILNTLVFFPNRKFPKELIKNKNLDTKISIELRIKSKKILSKTMNEILKETKYFKKKIDFLDIDVEGADLEVLESLDFSEYSPELICVEYIGEDKKNSNIFNFLINKNYKNIWSGVFSHIFELTAKT